MPPNELRPRRFPREMHPSPLPRPLQSGQPRDLCESPEMRQQVRSTSSKCQRSCDERVSPDDVAATTSKSDAALTSRLSCAEIAAEETRIDAERSIDCQRSVFGECDEILHGRCVRSSRTRGRTTTTTRTRTRTRTRTGLPRWHRSLRGALSIFLVGLLCATCSADHHQCAVGLSTPGKTWPQGDIVLEYGEPLRILCLLNKTFVDVNFPGKNASDLVFFRNKREMEPEYITVVNETTIAMHVEKPPPAEDMYYCKLRKDHDASKGSYEAVCLNKVVIGKKPEEPHNFSCISYNWENIVCTWEPVHNYVATRFSLVFKLPGRAGRRKVYPCPSDKDKILPPNTCLWDTSTNPIYRQPYEYYFFILNVDNVLGNASFQYKIHHYGHVIPAKPANLSVINKTSESALLHWSVPFPMQNFPPGLHHRVKYQNQWDLQKAWEVINITSESHGHKRYFNLTELEHANAVYDVRVFMKSSMAIGEDKWSNYSEISFKTSPKLPAHPPRMDMGSFEVVANSENRDVYVYWQAIPPHLENGDEFRYHVSHVEENGRKVRLQPNETTKTYAKFKGVSFHNYRFEIASKNVVGESKERSRIYVPSQYEIPREPISFTKIAFDGGLYELSWKSPPSMRDQIKNYTIFWCNNERDWPYQCTGYLDWKHVSSNTSIYNMTVPEPKKVYQFAISANTERASSGMVWAACTVIHNRVVGKMKSVWVNRVGSDTIEVGWKLDCSDRIGIVEGFNIYYCRTVDDYNNNCKPNTKMNRTIHADSHTMHGVVDGLQPHTRYKLTVAVLTKNGEGLHSDPLVNATLEAAPSNPRDVTTHNATNTTIWVTWKPPDSMNGVLRYYEVHYNGRAVNVGKAESALLKNLTAHQNYSISVKACTVSCSEGSPSVHEFTDIGTPGTIFAPTVRFVNSSQVVVSWQRPANPAGQLDYYQILSNDRDIYNSTSNEAQLPIPDCKTVGKERHYQFQVRAVNVAANNTHLHGPWSKSGEGNCYSDGPSFRVWIIIWIIGSLSGVAFLLCLAYSSKRMWLKCKAMQDVEVKLPPGLTPNMKLLQKVNEQHTRQLSTNSSGCSSGQESVTSSLTSDSHVSTDSGAEVDAVPVSPDKLLESPPTWESSNLRQRNVGTARPGSGTATTESARWDPFAKVTKSGETQLTDTLSLARSTPNLTDSGSGGGGGGSGYATSQHTWSSTGYISMPSSEELSSNPSPLPKEASNVGGGGGYSIVGVPPKPVRTKSDEGGGLTGDLLITPETEAKPVNPYVSLASLEQQKPTAPPLTAKERKAMHSLCDLDDLASFVEPISKSNLDDLTPFSISDKIVASKPYVQTGLMDSLKIPVASGGKTTTATPFAAATDAASGKPFVSSLPISSSTLKQSPRQKQQQQQQQSKPYVAVTSVSDAMAKSPYVSASIHESRNPYVNTSTAEETSTKPYVLTTSVFQMLQQQKQQQQQQQQQQKPEELDASVTDLEEKETEGTPSLGGYPFWQEERKEQSAMLEGGEKPVAGGKKGSSGYITIAEAAAAAAAAAGAPKLEPQQTVPSRVTTTPPYVQHQQRFNKISPSSQPQQTAVSQSDEQQYSKVAIIPTTMQ